MQRRTTDFWLQSFSSLLPCNQHSVHHKDTLQGYLVLTQTTAYNTDARSWNTYSPSLILTLSSICPQIYSSDPSYPSHSLASTLHINCFQGMHNCSTQSLVQRRTSTTSQAVAKTTRERKLSTPPGSSSFLVFLPNLSNPAPLHVWFPSFLHKLPMHRCHPHLPKIINPTAFIKPIFSGLNS